MLQRGLTVSISVDVGVTYPLGFGECSMKVAHGDGQISMHEVRRASATVIEC